MSEKHYGRYKRKPKAKKYWTARRRVRNKVKRVLRSSGLQEARRYAAQHEAVRILNELARNR